MECKFIQHGIALSYDQVVKPCCMWKISPEWAESNKLATTNLVTWHKSPQILKEKQLLDSDEWPAPCQLCKETELENRADSMRGNGNYSYADYKEDDITLEIRPGNTCNFACQTCWPEASSRVAQYHSQAGLINLKDLNSTRFDNFEFLLPIAGRIKDVILLGGEPFYDRACRNFLSWANKNLTANLMMFTNGSIVDIEFLKSYPGRITLIFSIDAVGRAAEYVRYGIDWQEFIKNYEQVKKLQNVDVRVNITMSVYNYSLIEDVISMLCADWPRVVTFGTPRIDYLRESSIPVTLRPDIIGSLERACGLINSTDIESGQQSNAFNAITSVINNLKNIPFDKTNNQQLIDFINKMDAVKGISAVDYSVFLKQLLEQKVS